MGEYYLLTKDKSLIPAMESLAVAYRDSIDWRSGGYAQALSSPNVSRAVAEGYGSCPARRFGDDRAEYLRGRGLSFDEATYERTHQGSSFCVANGAVGYGFKAWEHAVIKLKGESIEHAKAVDKRGVGYYLQTGMDTEGL